MTVTSSETSLKPVLVRPPEELRSSTAHLLKRLAWVVKERAGSGFESTGLSPYHYAVLVLLDERPPETQAMIADALGYDRSHLVGLLDELEERGLLARKRDPSDRRRHLVSLTPDGKRALGRLRAVVKQVDEEFLAPLDQKERASLHSLLLKLVGHHEPRYAADS